MPRSLVTGGAGFIGANLALTLQDLGHDVVVVDRAIPQASNLLTGFKGQAVKHDITFSLTLPGRFDFVFHQAALTDPRFSDDAQMIAQNLTGFRNALERCEKDGARLIYASTAGLYGNGPTPMHEDQPKDILTPYGQSKLEIDQQVLSYKGSVPMVGLRYFNVYGPRESLKGRPASMVFHLHHQIREFNKARLFNFGEHRRDFIYVKDAVSANLCAMTAPPGVYNVGTGVATTFNELVAVLNKVMGTNAPVEYFPMPYDAKTYQSHTLADTRRAKEKLGFEAKYDLEAGVGEYVKWLENRSNSPTS